MTSTQKEQQEQSLRERERRDAERMKMQHGRNANMQNAPEGSVPLEQVDELIKTEYSHTDQPGLHPANMPNPDSTRFKTTRDLEDITGNPGHRNINPNAPATSINREMPDARDNPASINEPPDVRQAPAAQNTPHSINEPPGSNIAQPAPEQSNEPQPPGPNDPPPPDHPPQAKAGDPDALEDEIEQAEADGDVKHGHRGGSGKPHRPGR
jgi:hypothetical protein